MPGLPGVVEPLPPTSLSVAASSQFHAQDELGNTEYGYSNTNSAKHEVGTGGGFYIVLYQVLLCKVGGGGWLVLSCYMIYDIMFTLLLY